MEEQILNEVLRKLNIILDEKNGLKNSGNGIICNNTEKTNQILIEKIDKKLFFLESRQQRMEDQNNQIIVLLKEISNKLK